MKKLFLLLLAAPGCVRAAHAASPADWNFIPISSYTDAATPGAVLFTSAPVQFVGISIGSAAPNSYVAIFRSTSATFTPDIATQTVVNTGWNSPVSGGPGYVPLWEMRNDSYTYISKFGTAQVTIWVRYPVPHKLPRLGTYPGLPTSGRMNDKINFAQ